MVLQKLLPSSLEPDWELGACNSTTHGQADKQVNYAAHISDGSPLQ
jgi:hypothetical protein